MALGLTARYLAEKCHDPRDYCGTTLTIGTLAIVVFGTAKRKLYLAALNAATHPSQVPTSYYLT